MGVGGSAAERAGRSRTWPRLSPRCSCCTAGAQRTGRTSERGISGRLFAPSRVSPCGTLARDAERRGACAAAGAPRGASARAGIQWDAQLGLGQVVGWLLEPALRLCDGRTLGSLMLLLVIHRKKKNNPNPPQFILLKSPLCDSPPGSPFSVGRIVPQCGAC